MNSIPRLLCLAVLSTAAYAQTSTGNFVSSDPSLANELPQTAPHSKPRAQVHVIPATAPAAPADLQIRTPADHAVLPTATVLRLKLNHALSTRTTRPGEQFDATLLKPVEFNGRTVIPAGASVSCQVESAHGSRRFAGKPSIAIKARSARMQDGNDLYFSASVVDTGNPRHLDVDSEGRVRGTNPSPMNTVELGALTGTGAIAGAVVAGPAGMVIGASSGALAATGHIVIKRNELTLPAGTELIFELDSPASTTRAEFGGIQ